MKRNDYGIATAYRNSFGGERAAWGEEGRVGKDDPKLESDLELMGCGAGDWVEDCGRLESLGASSKGLAAEDHRKYCRIDKDSKEEETYTKNSMALTAAPQLASWTKWLDREGCVTGRFAHQQES